MQAGDQLHRHVRGRSLTDQIVRERERVRVVDK